MFFAQRSRQRVLAAGSALLGYSGVVLVLALLFPGQPESLFQSFLRWLIGIPLTLVAWAALEFLGTRVLELAFWERIPSPVRVLLLAFAIFAMVVAVVAVTASFQ